MFGIERSPVPSRGHEFHEVLAAIGQQSFGGDVALIVDVFGADQMQRGRRDERGDANERAREPAPFGPDALQPGPATGAHDRPGLDLSSR